jgi:hypothetical protein
MLVTVAVFSELMVPWLKAVAMQKPESHSSKPEPGSGETATGDSVTSPKTASGRAN